MRHYKILRIVILFGILFPLILLDCGLPMFAYLELPDVGSIVSESGVVRFNHNTSVNSLASGFIGYDLYYKLYNNGNESDDAGISELRKDCAFISDEPIQLGVSRLENRGYRRVIANNDTTQIPTIEIPIIDRRTDLVVTIDVSYLNTANPNSGTVRLSSNNTPTSLHRRARYNANYKYLSIDDETYGEPDAVSIVQDDIDVSEVIFNELDTTNLHVGLFVISYGISPSFQTLYSEPLFLGYLSMHGSINQSTGLCR